MGFYSEQNKLGSAMSSIKGLGQAVELKGTAHPIWAWETWTDKGVLSPELGFTQVPPSPETSPYFDVQSGVNVLITQPVPTDERHRRTAAKQTLLLLLFLKW